VQRTITDADRYDRENRRRRLARIILRITSMMWLTAFSWTSLKSCRECSSCIDGGKPTLFDIIGSYYLLLNHSSSIMKSSTIALTVATALASFALLPSSLAFQATSPHFLSSNNNSHQQQHRQSTKLYEYIPSGFTKQSWAAFKKKEADAKKAKNLGRFIMHRIV
jgi:hypothetical protein